MPGHSKVDEARVTAFTNRVPTLIGTVAPPPRDDDHATRSKFRFVGKKLGKLQTVVTGVDKEVFENLTKPLSEALASVRPFIETTSNQISECGPVFEMAKGWYDATRGNDGIIYCVPQNHPRVRAVDPATGRSLLMGRDLGEAPNKFSACVLGLDSCVYAVPASFHKVLRINPSAQELNSQVVPVGGDQGDTGYKWQAAALDTHTGKIYAAPFNADGILEIDPHGIERRSGAQPTIRVIGEDSPALSTSGGAYFGCVYDPKKRRVIFVPANAPYFVALDTQTGTIEELGLRCMIWSTVKNDTEKLSRAVIINNKVYCAPFSLGRICVFNLHSEQTHFIGPKLPPGYDKYRGCIVGADGNIYFIPGWASGRILVVNRETEEVRFLGATSENQLSENHGAFSAVVRAGSGPSRNALALDGIGSTFLYCIPHRANKMLRVNTTRHLSYDGGSAGARPSVADGLFASFRGSQNMATDVGTGEQDAMYELWTKQPRVIVHGILHDFFSCDVLAWIGENIDRCSWSFGIECDETKWLMAMAGSDTLGKICAVKNQEVRLLLLRVSLHGEVLGPLRSCLKPVTSITYDALDLKRWSGVARSRDGRIFFVPLHDKHVLVLDPSDGSVNYFEIDGFPAVHRDSVMYTTAIEGKDGAIYGIPGDAKTVLRIDPIRRSSDADDDNDVVSTLPIKTEMLGRKSIARQISSASPIDFGLDDLEHKIGRVDPLEARWKWMGSTMTPDGTIYCAPYTAHTILRIDTGKSPPLVTQIPLPKRFLNVDEKFVGAVYSERTGCVYFIPACADSILKFEPSRKNACTYVGIPESKSETSKMNYGIGDPYKFTGAAIITDKKGREKIFTAPCHTTKLLVFDTETEKSDWAKAATSGGSQRLSDFELPPQIEWKYSAVTEVDGNIYILPGNCGLALKVDPTSNEVTPYGEELPTMSGRVYVGQGVVSHDGFIYCSTRNRSDMVRIDSMPADSMGVGDSHSAHSELGAFWQGRPTLWFVGINHNLFRPEFLDWFNVQSNKAGGSQWLADSCGRMMIAKGNTKEEKKKVADMLSKRIASIPNIVDSMLRIRDRRIQETLLSVPLVKGALVKKETVGPWLTALLAADDHCRESAVKYLELISRIEGFDELLPAMSLLKHLLPTILQLDPELKVRAAQTSIILGIMDEKLTERPLAVIYVAIDFSMMWAFTFIFGYAAMHVTRKFDHHPHRHFGLMIILVLINTACLLQEVVLQTSLYSVSKEVLYQYIGNIWNMFNIFSALSGYTLFILFFCGKSTRTGVPARVVLSIGALFVCGQIFNKVRGMSQDMATVVTTLSTVVISISQFLFVMIVIICCFAFLFYILLGSDQLEDEENEQVFGHSGEALLTMLRLTLGDFDRSWFEDKEDPHVESYAIFLYSLFVFAGSIVMLNVLIAVVSENYTAAKEKAVTNYFTSTLERVAALDTIGITEPVHFARYSALIHSFVRVLPRRQKRNLYHETPEELHRKDRNREMQQIFDGSLKVLTKQIIEQEVRQNERLAAMERHIAEALGQEVTASQDSSDGGDNL